jgi:DNA-binding transcriptional ArsR family regulator
MMRTRASVDVFAAVASPIRRSLLELLRSGETPATELAHQFSLTQPAVSQQLAVLRKAGLVAERRVGRRRLYHLNPGPLREVSAWVQRYEHFWNVRLDRLGELVDRAATASRPAGRTRRSSGRARGRT